ncbi:DNA-binding transcriptional regulator, MarR family [Streptomyces sp. SceaMP-e96]|uniref:MarR family winged helix-turn-helix transcriptional regulator n=1 Tax=unclassified Streptomyces TaxID=2593676 RepID=UPI000823CF47|nr:MULTISPECIES: MarR family transcriptional regulator [unclassified Streptomyces]MYT10898.1 MarR family transcriptional regulator [Streptomyces sp. SID4951]SCK05137.1 DNA-binding transcriptional regulator, MarR family [Streptomyces sp. SceaMP-e96]
MAENAADRGTTSGGRPTARPDLAAMVVPLGRALMAAEQPVLDAHGLTMWAYTVLLYLDETPVRTQAALAEAIRADKTRIIAVLDDLEARELIRRQPDPEDRRVRLLSLTTEGRRLRDAAQTAIQEGEERLLDRLPAADRAGFLRSLHTLSGLPELTARKPGRGPSRT